jgi:RHS repeat-associated protein
MVMPQRQFSAGGYRYGFNGKENDNDVKGVGNQQDYGMRIYDPRLGRFLSVDPITAKYPELTPYQFASNTPIVAIDLDGLEGIIPTYGMEYSVPFSAGMNEKRTKKFHNALEIKRKAEAAGAVTGAIFGGGALALPALGNALFGFAINPTIIANIGSGSAFASKYGADIANFVYGAVTGDANEPVPTNTGSQSADAGLAFRKLFQEGNVILDFFGGTASRYKGGISIDRVADFNLGGFNGTIEQFTEIFKGTKFKQIVADNPFGSSDYLKAGAELLETGGTFTVRGSSNNKFFNKILDGTMEGLENFTIESKNIIQPIGKTTEGVPIKSKDYYEVILKRK